VRGEDAHTRNVEVVPAGQLAADLFSVRTTHVIVVHQLVNVRDEHRSDQQAVNRQHDFGVANGCTVDPLTSGVHQGVNGAEGCAITGKFPVGCWGKSQQTGRGTRKVVRDDAPRNGLGREPEGTLGSGRPPPREDGVASSFGICVVVRND
jgi:hypothetical protein